MQRINALTTDLIRSSTANVKQEDVVSAILEANGKGYWVVNNPKLYVKADILNLAVDTELLNLHGNDRIVFWPDYNVVGRIRDIVGLFKRIGNTVVTVGEVNRLTKGKHGDPPGQHDISVDVVRRNSLDPHLVRDRYLIKYTVQHHGCERSSVIPYMYVNSKLYILAGKDGDTGNWSDFGGCNEPKEQREHAAAREAYEESMGILDKTKVRDAIKGKTPLWYGHTHLYTYKITDIYAMNWPNMFRAFYSYVLPGLKPTFTVTKVAPDFPEGYFEKTDMEWFLYEDIVNTPNMFLDKFVAAVVKMHRSGMFV